MCGIAGIHASGGARFHAALLEGMTQSLAHRGPDDFGFAAFAPGEEPLAWAREGMAGDAMAKTALGNRRLKILDLSPAGHQPMTDASGDLWIAYNGEVYNYLELREELRGRGHEFRSGCDTEVILHAYAEWGTDCFARFNGMWAIALFDRRSGELVLSRDRFGVKPLYVARLDDGIAFASEVKALLAHPEVPRRPNLRTVYNYAARHYRWVDGHRDTFFDGIEQLPAAGYWVVSPEGGIREERFWALDGSRRSELSDGEALERFRDLFADAVRVRLRADVPVATLLSGGLDSSSVTCMAAHLSDQPVTTFSARFDEEEFDEGRYIEATVRHAGADGRMIHPRSGALLDTLDRMLDFNDEPICTATWFAHWLVMEQVADQGFPVILNGHVGDELFAGYWDHYMYNLADLERHDRDAFEAEMAAWRENHGRDPSEYPRTLERIEAVARGALGPADSLTQYDAAVGDDVRAAAAVPDRPDPFAGRDLLTSRLYQELTYETVPATLRPEDRNSMAFSIESRSPFLDYRLVEYAFALPSRLKIRGGLGKWAIREGMAGILPDEVRLRRDKQGLVAPTERWFRGANHDAVRDVLASPELRDRGLLDQAEVLRVFDEHAAGNANHYMAIWQWLNLELWMRKTFDRTPSTAVGAAR